MNDIVKQVGTWLVIALLGYAIASMQDRYTATQAAIDRAEMREFIKEVMSIHLRQGPHDEVSERLLTLELGQKAILERIDHLRGTK